MLKEKFGDSLSVVQPLLQYLKSGEAELEGTEDQLNNVRSRFTEETTTVTGSYADMHELV